jgi:tetratricopeptide (TPR) repeat protein
MSVNPVKYSCPRLVKPVLLLFVILLATGCATKIKVNMLKPAQYHQASLTKTVAVLPFSGPHGSEFTAELEGILGSINIDDKAYFTLVDRAAIDKTLSEQKLSQSGLIDSRTAARIGQMVGAKGIYTGAVTLATSADSPYTERRSECVQRQIKTDDKGNQYEGNCIRYRNYNVNCTKRLAQFAASPKLIEVATGKILYSNNLKGSAASAGCEDGTAIKGAEELLETAKNTVKRDFRKDIAPFYETREVALLDSTDGIDSSTAKEKLKQGIQFAGKGRMDSACELWGEAGNLAPNAVSLVYNLGVCAESRGDVEAALALYRKAEKITGKPEDNIILAITRTSEAVKNQQKLKEQMKSP